MKAAKEVKKIRGTSGLEITIRRFEDGRYGFDWMSADDGNRKKIRLHDPKAAEQRAKEFLDSGKAGKLDLMTVSRKDFEEFLRWRASRIKNTPKVPALYESFLKSKEGKGRSEWTLASLKSTLKTFSEDFTCRIDEVKREDLEDWLNKRNVGPRRYNNIVNAIVALCRFARHEGHLGNDLLPIERISRRFHRPKIETYTPDELIAILKAAPAKWVPAITLGAFCGLRPEECSPNPMTTKPGLTWEDVKWDRDSIDVPAAVAKGMAGGKGRRRIVPLCDAAKDILTPWRHASGPVAPRERISHSKRYWVGEFEWKSDALRHSYASYRLAIIHNMHQLSIEMGNSIHMIKTHYLDMKYPDEAARWFSIRSADFWNSMELSFLRTA